ncbi:MAG: hypothetical protein NZ846_11660, partial [Thermus sp.]
MREVVINQLQPFRDAPLIPMMSPHSQVLLLLYVLEDAASLKVLFVGLVFVVLWSFWFFTIAHILYAAI